MQRTRERSCVAVRPTTAGSETEFKGVTMTNESMVNASQGVLPWHNGTYLPYYLHSTGVAASYILSYLLVLLLCVGGNGLVCLVVLRNRNMRTITNIFIFNLAVSDLLVGVFCIPTTLIDSLITGWPFSQFTCTMSNLIQGMSVSASVFTLVAIAVDRFMGIVYPFRHRMRPMTALLAILIIWMLAFAIIFPSAATLTVMHLQDTYMIQDNQTFPLFVCYEDWPRPELRRIYTTIIFAHVYLAPLGLISVMYGCIAAKLVSKLRQVGVAEGRRARSRRKAKVVKMLILVAVLFMLSWLPLWTLMLLADYRDLDQQQIDFLSSYLFPVAHWLAFSNSGINPVIYGFYNENFRRGFQAAVACSGCPMQGVAGSPSWRACSCCHSAILPPNKVSSRNVTVRAHLHRDQHLTGLPQGTPQGIQGILLEGINRIAAPIHVSGAWEE